MIKINEVIKYVENIAPVSLKENWDNVGLLIGDRNNSTEKIVFSMDLTNTAIDFAIENNAKMIITHHPIIFKPLSKVNSDTVRGEKIIKCIKNDISVYTAHTNFDSCLNGTSDAVFNALKLTNKKVACVVDEKLNAGLARIGEFSTSITFEDLLKSLKKIGFLNFKYLGNENYYSKKIKKVCILGGSFDMQSLEVASKENCDVFITGDIGYHNLQECLDLNIIAIGLGHYNSEIFGLKRLMENLSKDLEVSTLLCDIDEVATTIYK